MIEKDERASNAITTLFAIMIIMEKMGKWQCSGPRYLGGLTPCASGPQQGVWLLPPWYDFVRRSALDQKY